jgi:Ras-related protein Rab-32
MDDFCREKGFSGWFSTSAKDNTNVEEASRFLVQKIIENDKWAAHSRNARDDDGVRRLMHGSNHSEHKHGARRNDCAC